MVRRSVLTTALVALAVGAWAPQAHASFAFTSPLGSPFGLGALPTSVAVADFNGDGHPDLLSAGQAGNLSVLLGDGTGTFVGTSYSPVQVGGQPVSLAVGDLNGDKVPDVAFSLYESASVATRAGDLTQGLVLTHAPLEVGIHPYTVRFGEFNGDGNLDLVVANSGSETVSEFYGDGTGGFVSAPASPIKVGGKPWSLGVGDLNGDGRDDLAIGDLEGYVTVLLNDGSNGWKAASGSPFMVGSSPYSIAVADLNGDGKQDLAVADQGSANVSVLLGNGSGGFAPSSGSPFAVGKGPFSVAIGDFNGDGKPDLVTSDTGSNDATVLLGDGSGSFSPAPGSPYTTGEAPWSVAVGDFNGDGKPDFATADYTNNEADVFINASRPVRTLSAGALAFGTSTVGSITPAQTVSLGSSADAALLTSTVQLSGPNANDFAISQNTCAGARVPAGGTPCSIGVRFAPSIVGAETATITVTDNSGSPATVALSGTGTAAGGGLMSPPPIGELRTASATPTGVTDRVTCEAAAGESCTAVETLTSVVTTVGGRPVAVAASRRHKSTTIVGTKSTTIQAGQSATIKVTLNARGRSLLKRFHRLPVKLRVALKASGQSQVRIQQRTLTIKVPVRRHR